MADIKRQLSYDHTQDKLIVKSVQDVEAILDANKAQYNPDNKRHKHDVFNHVARIPNIIIEKWLLEEGLNEFNPAHKERVRAKLNSPEYRYLRTKPGRL